MAEDKNKRIPRWYFGGIAGSAAVCATHPLDTLKVLLQTQQEGKMGMVEIFMHTVKTEGFFQLYNGLSATVVRQLTYSTIRFSMYDWMKRKRSGPDAEGMTFASRIWMAAVSGACGGFAGSPADMVNVRMQSDIRLPKAQRRNYLHVIHGLYKVFRTEGFAELYTGVSVAVTRAVIMSIGQISFYEQAKLMLLNSNYFEDNLTTLITASLIASAFGTLLSQPFDVLKTRLMNAKPGEFDTLADVFWHTAKQGPQAFFKGSWPAFLRLGPHTILMYMFMQQLKKNFGIIPSESPGQKA